MSSTFLGVSSQDGLDFENQPALRAAKAAASARLLRPRSAAESFSAFAAANPIAGPNPNDNVVAVGLGEKVTKGISTGVKAVKVFVRVKFASDAIGEDDRIPAEIEGVPVDVEQIGTVRIFRSEVEAQAATPNPRVRIRPARPGSSIGFVKPGIRMAGTFGAVVRRGKEQFILSNNHVLADENRLPLGSPILQPGPLDGGGAGDEIATLTEFVALDSVGMNKVDAAIAAVDAPNLVDSGILFIGPPAGQTRAAIDMTVHKFGRTTSYRVGRVISVATDVRVAYETGEMMFEDQIIIRGINGEQFSAGGDSGSLILQRGTNRAVGLLFAGSSTHTIANHIEDVLDAFKVTLA
jgi:hypothetical protein